MMMSHSGISVKLTDTNYELWKNQMKSLLIINDLWTYVDGSEQESSVQDEKWKRKDSKALALINLSVSSNLLNHIKKAQTSKEAWDSIKQAFESTGPVRKSILYKQLLRIKKGPRMSMSQHVNEFSTAAERLEEAGVKLPEEVLSIMLLSSLPPEYESFSLIFPNRNINNVFLVRYI